MRSLLYLNRRTPSPFPTEPEQFYGPKRRICCLVDRLAKYTMEARLGFQLRWEFRGIEGYHKSGRLHEEVFRSVYSPYFGSKTVVSPPTTLLAGDGLQHEI